MPTSSGVTLRLSGDAAPTLAGIEENPAAVRLSGLNARINGIGNFRTLPGRVEQALRRVRVGQHQAAILEEHQRGPAAHPFLQRNISRQLLEVVLLAADPHPETDAQRITKRPEHCDLVVAEDHGRVGAIARVAQGPDSKGPVVNEVAEEDRAPAVRWIGFEGVEQPLEVAVDVADDQDRQIVSGHFPMLIAPWK